jgi:hypothetical protein
VPVGEHWRRRRHHLRENRAALGPNEAKALDIESLATDYADWLPLTDSIPHHLRQTIVRSACNRPSPCR